MKAGLPVVPAFDGFRAFAILGVVTIHLLQFSGVLFTAEATGARIIWATLGRAVEILFIVSGFVIFLPAAASKGNNGRYLPFLIRRGARLLPAYWLITLISALLVTFFALSDPASFALSDPAAHNQTLATPDLGDLISNFTLTAVPLGYFSDQFPVGMGINLPVWTLSPEVAFYLVMPLFALAFFRRPMLGLAVAAVITATWMLVFNNLGSVSENLGLHLGSDETYRLWFVSHEQLPNWAFSFGLGMAAAVLWVRISSSGKLRSKVEKRVGPVALVALVATLVSGWFASEGFALWHSVTWSMTFSASLAVLMLSVTFLPTRWQRPFISQKVRQLGDISYGIYLSHYVFITLTVSALALPQDGSLEGLLILVAIVLPCSVLYGYLSARFLEQPIRRWARKFGRRGEA